MTNAQAMRRYLSALIPSGIVFIGLSYAIKQIDGTHWLPDAGLFAVALLPVAALLSMFWAHWRYMNEIDEYLRSIQYKAAFVALAVVISIASGWGFLEMLVDVPALGMYWLNPIFWIVLSVAVVVFSSRDVRA